MRHRDIATILNFQSLPSDEDISCYLAVGDRNGKLAVATVCAQYEIHAGTRTDMPPLFLPGERHLCRLSRH